MADINVIRESLRNETSHGEEVDRVLGIEADDLVGMGLNTRDMKGIKRVSTVSEQTIKAREPA